MRALQSPTLQPQTPLLFPPPKITAATLSSFPPPPGTMGAPAFPQPSVTQHHKPAPDPLPMIPAPSSSSTDAKQDSNTSTNEPITNEPISNEPVTSEPGSQDPISQGPTPQEPTSQDPSQEPEALSLQPVKDDTVAAASEATQEVVKEEEKVQEVPDKQPEPAPSISAEDKEQISNSNEVPDVTAPPDDMAMDTSNPIPTGEVKSTDAPLDEPPVNVQPAEPVEDEVVKNTLPPVEGTINNEEPIAESSSVTDLGSSAVSDGVTPQPSTSDTTTTSNDTNEGTATTEGMAQEEATTEGESAGGEEASSVNEKKEETLAEEAMECETGRENKETSPQAEQ